MPDPSEPITELFQGRILKVQLAAAPPVSAPILALHGWTGDENSMSIFTHGLSSHHHILQPRGTTRAYPSGYGWAQKSPSFDPDFQDYCRDAIELLRHLDAWATRMALSLQHFNVAGFSQGAALALALTVVAPERVQRLAILAGFLPANPPASINLEHLHIFITHGTADEIIPFDQAVRTQNWLLSQGAQVEFCQSNTSHKLGAACLRSFHHFMKADSRF